MNATTLNILCFFSLSQGFDWCGLEEKSLQPPIIPSVKSSTDTTNFDQFGKDLNVPNDETSGWDADF